MCRIFRKTGSVDLYLVDGCRRSPDKSFCYDGSTFPSLILEVANSQQNKNLSELTKSYLKGSRAHIRMIIGLDLDDGKSKMAYVLVQRVKCEESRFTIKCTKKTETCANRQTAKIESHLYKLQPFRDADGAAVDSILVLHLKDFLSYRFLSVDAINCLSTHDPALRTIQWAFVWKHEDDDEYRDGEDQDEDLADKDYLGPQEGRWEAPGREMMKEQKNKRSTDRRTPL